MFWPHEAYINREDCTYVNFVKIVHQLIKEEFWSRRGLEKRGKWTTGN